MGTVLTPETEAQLRAGLHDVCATADIDPGGAELIKYTINAVYRLANQPIVVRLNCGEQAVARAERVVHVAKAFAALDLPIVQLVPNIAQPVQAGRWVGTFWTHLPQPAGQQYRPLDLAAPLKRLHAVERLETPLPDWDTVGEATRRIRRVEQLDPAQLDYARAWAHTLVGVELESLLEYLRDWAEQIERQLPQIDWHLPKGVIHGDARIGNLLNHPDGQVVLCDLDSVCIGPREWDLTPIAMGPVRFGHSPALYQAFTRTYGFDITTLRSGWQVLRETRELQLVTSVIGNLHGRPDVATQLAHRLRTLLSNDINARWESYQ